MAYTNIKSKFIKEVIKKTSWKNRDYIQDLKNIEHFALGVNFGMYVTKLKWDSLSKKYPKEWKTIWEEVRPGKLVEIAKAEKEERQKEREEDLKFKREEEKERRKESVEWKKMGGK